MLGVGQMFLKIRKNLIYSLIFISLALLGSCNGGSSSSSSSSSASGGILPPSKVAAVPAN